MSVLNLIIRDSTKKRYRKSRSWYEIVQSFPPTLIILYHIFHHLAPVSLLRFNTRVIISHPGIHWKFRLCLIIGNPCKEYGRSYPTIWANLLGPSLRPTTELGLQLSYCCERQGIVSNFLLYTFKNYSTLRASFKNLSGKPKDYFKRQQKLQNIILLKTTLKKWVEW